MDYGADVEVRAPGLGDYVAVNIPVSGAMEVEHRGTRFVADPAHAAVFSPDGDLRMRYRPDLRQFIVRIDVDALGDVLCGLAPAVPDAPLRFAPSMDVAGPAAAFTGAVRLLREVLEPSSGPVPPVVGARLVEMVLTALLVGQPSSATAALRAAP